MIFALARAAGWRTRYLPLSADTDTHGYHGSQTPVDIVSDLD